MNKVQKSYYVFGALINLGFFALQMFFVAQGNVFNAIVAPINLGCALFLIYCYIDKDLASLKANLNPGQKVKIWFTTHIFGTTEVHWSGKKRHFYCIDCGSQIPFARIFRRNWQYCSCESCDGYTHFMVAADKTKKEETEYNDNLGP